MRSARKPVTFDGVYRRPAHRQRDARRRHQPAGARSAASRASRSRPARSVWSDAVALPFVHRSDGARRPQARGQLPCRGRERPDDLARQGAADLLRQRARRRREGRGRGREPRSPTRTASWYFLDAVDMMAPADTSVIVAFGDSITDGTASTHERRRPLAERAVAPACTPLRQPRRGGQCRHRRQPGRRPGRVLAAEAVPRRTVRERALRARRAQPVRRHHGDLARRHQRLQHERQRERRAGAATA